MWSNISQQLIQSMQIWQQMRGRGLLLVSQNHQSSRGICSRTNPRKLKATPVQAMKSLFKSQSILNPFRLANLWSPACCHRSMLSALRKKSSSLKSAFRGQLSLEELRRWLLTCVQCWKRPVQPCDTSHWHLMNVRIQKTHLSCLSSSEACMMTWRRLRNLQRYTSGSLSNLHD